MRLGLSHLYEHKFRHIFQDTVNPLCECGKDNESTIHFFFHCTNFLIPRQTLFQKIRNIDDSILSRSETQLTQTLLYGNQNCRSSINRLIIISTIKYLIWTENSNDRFLMKVFFFFVKKAGCKTRFTWGYYVCEILFFLLLRHVNKYCTLW